MTIEKITSMKPQDLIARIRRDRAALESMWNGLSEKEMTRRPGPQSDWSIKDLIAHLTYWEQRMLDNVQQLMQGGKDEDVMAGTQLDAVNKKVFDAHKDRPLNAVLTDWAESLEKIENAVRAIPADILNDEDRFDGRSLLVCFIGDTFGHYDDHRDDLQRYVESLR